MHWESSSSLIACQHADLLKTVCVCKLRFDCLYRFIFKATSNFWLISDSAVNIMLLFLKSVKAIQFLFILRCLYSRLSEYCHSFLISLVFSYHVCVALISNQFTSKGRQLWVMWHYVEVHHNKVFPFNFYDIKVLFLFFWKFNYPLSLNNKKHMPSVRSSWNWERGGRRRAFPLILVMVPLTRP